MSINTEFQVAKHIPSFTDDEVRRMSNGRIVYKDDPQSRVGDVFREYYAGPLIIVCRWDDGRTSFRKISGEEFARAVEQGLPLMEWTHGRRILIDIATCPLTLDQFMEEVYRIKAQHPEMEIFMDGSLYAICGEMRRPKR